jgi:glutathionylspermidine synthase
MFLDPNDEPMFSIFKLYPWEAMVAEEFGPHAIATYPNVRWIEPIWKMLLSNKGILPILWELYPGHENLLEAHLDGPEGMRAYARKPLLSREGANITLIREDGQAIETDGPYGGRRTVCQALAQEAVFSAVGERGRYPVLGLWMVDQECCGMGIRESAGRITDNWSSFVPHYFV